MKKNYFVILIVSFFVARGSCVETSEFDAVIERLSFSEEFTERDVEMLSELPMSIVPILTSRLETASKSLPESRLYFCLVHKVKQHKEQLDGAAMIAALDALAEKCRGDQPSIISRLRLLTGIRHPKVRAIAESFANDFRPKVREAAQALKTAAQ